jgi:hypothetical protein
MSLDEHNVTFLLLYLSMYNVCQTTTANNLKIYFIIIYCWFSRPSLPPHLLLRRWPPRSVSSTFLYCNPAAPFRQDLSLSPCCFISCGSRYLSLSLNEDDGIHVSPHDWSMEALRWLSSDSIQYGGHHFQRLVGSYFKVDSGHLNLNT